MNNRKKQIVFIISIIVLSIAISLTVALIVAYIDAGKDWIGASIGSLGNIVGGIIGGYIAYFVAAYQIESTANDEKAKLNNRYNNLKLLLIEELEFVKNIIQVMISSKDYNPAVIKEQVTFAAWEIFKLEYALNLPKDDFSKLSGLYRRLHLLKYSNQEDVTEARLEKMKLNIQEIINMLSTQ